MLTVAKGHTQRGRTTKNRTARARLHRAEPAIRPGGTVIQKNQIGEAKKEKRSPKKRPVDECRKKKLPKAHAEERKSTPHLSEKKKKLRRKRGGGGGGKWKRWEGGGLRERPGANGKGQ